MNPQSRIPDWGWELLAGADVLGIMLAVTVVACITGVIALRPRRRG